jgi:uncharacterized membrane protein YdbT with pleckstrin-like domain
MNDELVVFRGSPSLLTRIGPIFLACLVIAAGITGVYMLQNNWLWIIPALALIHILVIVVVTRSIVYEVTSQRIRLQRGIFTKRTDELELYRVKDTTLVEPFFLRMAGKGNIEIATFDPSTPNLSLQAVSKARELRENLRKYTEECRERKGVRLTEFDNGSPPAQ